MAVLAGIAKEIEMLVSSLQVFNYKSCRDIFVEFNDVKSNVLIGENDCGKTSILNSIKFLLDSSSSVNLPNQKSEKSDLSHSPLNVSYINDRFTQLGLPPFLEVDDKEYIVFAARFKVEEIDIDNERESSVHLKWILESTGVGNEFWKIRVFETQSCDSDVYYSGLYLSSDVSNELFNLNQNQTNTALREKNPDGNHLVNDNGQGQHSIYEKVRSILQSNDTVCATVKFKDDAKKSKWKADLKFFPEYQYLSWAESLESINKVAATILDEALGAEISRAERVSRLLKEKAQRKIDAQLNNVGIQNEVPSITGISAKVSFELQRKITDLFVQKVGAQDDVHIENQGEGIKRQIWFALLKLQANIAEMNASNKRYFWCFDEPETHLHPKAQRDFFSAIQALSRQNFQILVSTHSTIFVDSSKVEDIKTLKINNHYTNVGTVATVEDIYATLGLKNSDFLFYNKFLIVEGHTEETLIPILYHKFKNKTLKEDNVQLINLKGCTNADVASDVLEQLINGFSKMDDLAIYMFDSDTRKVPSPKVFLVGKQDLEDCLPIHIWPEIVRDVFDGLITITELEIQEVINAIPNVAPGVDCQESQKFASRLKAVLRTKLVALNRADDITLWPNKSHKWGSVIANKINVEHIPSCITNAFDALT
ncbi:AAA family ATPase [Pectobacterium versatile]|uniref:AAA family ATPase n=1 Tax=Pectobacterium versatile TaxID=2488639 RepID=UPI001B39EE84|nr:AAA family ATPase [Pectobacterium versatile]MBQ4769884.1 AAA family ATPase [Pectobacterium versatile]